MYAIIRHMAELLTSAQTALRLNVSVATIHRWAKAGELPAAQKLPGHKGDWLFDPDVIEAEAVARRVAPPISA